MIQFYNVSAKYDKHSYALNDVNLKIAKGEFVYLTGPSGAGKSTLMKLIYQDVRPSSGSLTIAEFDSASLKKRHLYKLRRKIGIVFQDFKLFDDRSVYENIAFVLKVTGVRKGQIKKRVTRVLADVGLADKSQKRPTELSGGEQQRVAIARAIINEPYILIADEPTGNLDPAVSKEILELLIRINRRGTAILMATHNLDLILEYPQRRVHIESGSLRSV